MSNVLIINAHHHYPFSPGNLNQSFVDKAQTLLANKGYNIQISKSSEGFDVEAALAQHQWADIVLVQMPLNWMGVPWSFKKYMDEVYTAGMGGALCHGDGRSADAPQKNYGRGGTLGGTRYMLSVTANAPQQAFNDPEEFFDGHSIDDLLMPMHMNFKFFDMTPMPTFSAFDVMKNAQPEADFARFQDHLEAHF